MNTIKSMLINLIFNAPRPSFLRLANLYFSVKNSSCRIEYRENSYIIKDGNYELHLASRKRFLRYKNGVDSILNSLGRYYFLNDIKLTDGDVFVDCGANIGELGLYLRSKKLNCKYLAFEPSAKEYNALVKNIKNSKELFNIGLWNKKDNLKFYLASDTADSSLIETDFYQNVIEVPVDRLDNLISTPIKLLKIEAEGAEPEALQGVEKILHLCDYIVVDTSPERGKLQEDTTVDVVNYLLNRNFILLKINFSKRVICLFKNKNK